MRVLIDTNVLADLLLGRDPYYDIAYNILTMCADKKVYGYIAAHAVIDQMTNMIATANSFIKELSEDMKRLNKNIDDTAKMGQEMISKILSPMSAKMLSGNYTGIEQK